MTTIDDEIIECSNIFNESEKIILGPNVKTIEEYAFSNFTNLKDVTSSSYDEITIGEGAFSGCINLESVFIQNPIILGDGCFTSCRNLQKVSIDDSRIIPENTFAGCENLHEIILSETETIDTSALSGCINLTDVYLKDINTKAPNVFRDCNNLQELHFINNSNQHYSQDKIDEYGITHEITIIFDMDNSSIKYKPSYIERQKISLNVVERAEKCIIVKTRDCISNFLIESKFYRGVETIPHIIKNGFCGRIMRTDYLIDSIYRYNTLYYKIGDNIHSVITYSTDTVRHIIEIQAFCVNQLLKYKYGFVIFNELINAAEECSYQDVILRPVRDPKTIEFYKKNGLIIKSDDANGKIMTRKLNNLTKYNVKDQSKNPEDEDADAPQDIRELIDDIKTDINPNEFNGNNTIQSVKMLNVTRVENNAFMNCNNLTEVILHNATYIGISAFQGCNSLTKLDLSNATYIGISAFQGCISLTKLDLSNATYVGVSAFQGCSGLTEINLYSVNDIIYDAFNGCTELKTIYSRTGGEVFFNMSGLSSKVRIKNIEESKGGKYKKHKIISKRKLNKKSIRSRRRRKTRKQHKGRSYITH